MTAVSRAALWWVPISYAGFLVLATAVLFSIVWRRTPFDPLTAAGATLAVLVAGVVAVRMLSRAPADAPAAQPWPGAGRAALAAFGLGLVIRLLWQYFFPYEQYSDALFYWEFASNLVEHGDYFQENDEGLRVYAWRPPGLPLILAAFIWVFGPQDWIPFVINIIVYGLTALVIWKLGLRLAGERAAVAAVALFAVYPTHVAIIGISETELLSLFLLLLCFWGVLKLAETGPLGALLIGLAFGFAALSRPTFVLLIGFAGIYFVLQVAGRLLADERWGSLLRNNLLALLGAAILIGAWGYRNNEVLGQWVFTTTMGGVNFYYANNPAAHTGIDNMERNIFQEVAGETERSRVGFEWGMEFVREDPRQFAFNIAERFTRTSGYAAQPFHWVLFDVHGLPRDSTVFAIAETLANLWWFLVVSCAIVAAIKHRRTFMAMPWCSLMVMMTGFLFVVHAVFQGVSRYNIPTAGLFLLMASFLLVPAGRLATERARADAGEPAFTVGYRVA
jgi:4-amino-4-deoxy-L-arabinose transferase-like glycosyltransferase